MQLRWRTILRHRGEVIPEYNRDAGREIGDPARYPHDQPTDLLIFGCVEPEGRRVVIGAIPRGRRERKERTERAGVQHRREQKRNRESGIALAALPEDSRTLPVLTALVALAESLGMAVTAEGAETLEDLALIRKLGCDEIQGFLFGRPMAADEAQVLASASKPVSAGEEVQPRAPRHSLIRRGALRWRGGSLPVRLRNISAEGAMIESDQPIDAGAAVELDLSDGVRLTGEVRWSQDGRIGLKFLESFDLQRLGSNRQSVKAGSVVPDYLRTELEPDSPWAARSDKLTIREVKRRSP